MTDEVKPYTSEDDLPWMRDGGRLHATVHALEAAQKRIAELEALILNGARVANALTQETQTPEEMASDLVRQVREARLQRDELQKRIAELEAEAQARREEDAMAERVLLRFSVGERCSVSERTRFFRPDHIMSEIELEVAGGPYAGRETLSEQGAVRHKDKRYAAECTRCGTWQLKRHLVDRRSFGVVCIDEAACRSRGSLSEVDAADDAQWNEERLERVEREERYMPDGEDRPHARRS
ncbi:MAG: hypothetical protein SFW67_28490 [Myxococcaceae bacterium]|nr:hypothetical protein [Myxococcaceae bacterium]